MNWKYVTFVVLLAGWVWFCYWLLSVRIIPVLNKTQAPLAIMHMDGLGIPLAYMWGSAEPFAGDGFEGWIAPALALDSLDQVMLIQGGYFRDEAVDELSLKQLARRRVENVLQAMKINRSRVLVELVSQPINADVRSHPFAAFDFEIMDVDEIVFLQGDTAQLCFPFSDSIACPPIMLEKFDKWNSQQQDTVNRLVTIVGIADGSGVAESADRAFDRAAFVKDRMIAQGWNADFLEISTGQRKEENTLLNRCVLVYYEPHK